MARNKAAWLLAELPQLEREGVVDAATAARLRERYVDALSDGGFARGLSAVLGSLLVGLGVILLVAHNWDQWPRALRLTLAALPLAAGQAACAWTLLKRRDSIVWRESAALFAALAFAALLALVGQIFHFPSDLDRYLLVCALVALPLVYVLDASLLAIVIGGALCGWVGAQSETARQPVLVVLAFAALLPHLLQRWRDQRAALRSLLLGGAFVPQLLIALCLSLPSVDGLIWLWLAACAALLLLLDAQIDTQNLWLRRPLRAYGEVGWAVFVLSASFPGFWTAYRGEMGFAAAGWQSLTVLGGVAAGIAALALLALRQARLLLLALSLPLLLLGALRLSGQAATYASVLAATLNVYALAIGIALIREGLRQRELRQISSGLTLLAGLVLLRFFGGEWSFVARGLAFVAIGLGFLFAHAWLRRRLHPQVSA